LFSESDARFYKKRSTLVYTNTKMALIPSEMIVHH